MADLSLLATVATSLLTSGVIGLLLKARFDRQQEILKASLQRTSSIHQRQVETLIGLYTDLERAESAAMSLTSTPHTLALPGAEDYWKNFHSAVKDAETRFVGARLLLSAALARKCDAFFLQLHECGWKTAKSYEPEVFDSPERDAIWQEAEAIALSLRRLLEDIEQEARRLIHGET